MIENEEMEENCLCLDEEVVEEAEKEVEDQMEMGKEEKEEDVVDTKWRVQRVNRRFDVVK